MSRVVPAAAASEVGAGEDTGEAREIAILMVREAGQVTPIVFCSGLQLPMRMA